MSTHVLPVGTPSGRLLICLSSVLLGMVGVLLWLHPTVEGVRQVIRFTARGSFLFFLLAYLAAPMARWCPHAWTRAWLSRRRQFGLALVVSHGLHLLAIVAFARRDPEGFAAVSSLGNQIAGGLAYLFLVAMALTSFRAPAAWLGTRAWAVLHRLGMHYLWLSFLITFGKRVPMSPAYLVPVGLLLAALALRRLAPRR